MSLAGQYAWVIGGVGTVGKGLARGLLRAGGTVLVNSRYPTRLRALAEDLGHPKQLIALQGSMLPGESEKLTEQVMEMTSGRLDHVVAHSGVQWWSNAGDESSTLATASRILDLGADEFASAAMQLPRLHFEAARLLVPRLRNPTFSHSRSYTMVTGGQSGAGLAAINAHAISGLSAALRNEVQDAQLTVSEVCMHLEVDRSAAERRAAPRATPLSHELGSIVAGIAAAPAGAAAGLHTIASAEDVASMMSRFEALDAPFDQH